MHVIVSRKSRFFFRKRGTSQPEDELQAATLSLFQFETRFYASDMLAWKRKTGLRIRGTRLEGSLSGAQSLRSIERGCTRTSATTVVAVLPASPSGASQRRKVSLQNERGKNVPDQTTERDFVVQVLSLSKRDSGHRGLEDRSLHSCYLRRVARPGPTDFLIKEPVVLDRGQSTDARTFFASCLIGDVPHGTPFPANGSHDTC
jgi:hypothetical protein